MEFRHKWGKWKEETRAPIKEFSHLQPEQGWYAVGIAVVQSRECGKCGKKQFDRTEIRG